MGTQISKASGLLDQAVARRQQLTQERRDQRKVAEVNLEEAKKQRAAEVEQSREKRVFAGAPEVSRNEAAEAQRTNTNARERVKQQAESGAGAAEQVIQMYGLDDPLKVLALNNERKDYLRKQRTISIQEQRATIKAASEERGRTNAQFQETIVKRMAQKKVYKEDIKAMQAKLDDLLAQREAVESRKMADLAGLAGAIEAAARMTKDIEADLEKAEAAPKVNDEAQARIAAQDVAKGEEQLREAFSQKQFATRQLNAQRPGDATPGAFEEVSTDGLLSPLPETTLGLVAPDTQAQDEARQREVREEFAVIEPRQTETEPFFLRPEEIKTDTPENLAESRERVAEALESVRDLSADTTALEGRIRDASTNSIVKLKSELPSEPLPSTEEARRAADDAARLTIEDPARAIQAQALVSVDMAMRVLR